MKDINIPEFLDSRENVHCFVDSDLDGTGCRVLLKYYFDTFGKDPQFIYQVVINRVESIYEQQSGIEFKKFLRGLTDNDLVIFADLIPSMDTLKKMLKITNVWIFDHHTTSREDIESSIGIFDTYYYDTDRCSAKLIYDFFSKFDINKCAEEYAELVTTYDLYKSKDPLFEQAKALNMLLWEDRVGGNDLHVRRQIGKLKELRNYGFKFLPKEIEKIEKRKDIEISDFQDAKKTLKLRVDGRGDSYGFFSHFRNISVIANLILEDMPDLRYIAVHNTYLKDENKISLRCMEGFNVREIAEQYGGGGHNTASGLQLDDDFFEDFKAGTRHLI